MDRFRASVSFSCQFLMDLNIKFVLQSIDGTMTLLEITNRGDSRRLIEQIDESYRSLPPLIMLIFSLKGIIVVIFNIVVLFFITLAGWEVVDGNKRKTAMKFITDEKKTCEPSTEL